MFKNTAKTAILLAGLGGLIVTIAGVLGGGSSSSLTIGLLFAFLMVGGSYWFSDKLALKSAKARVITKADAPMFYGMIEDLATRANMPMPRVAISPNDQPNAFATGRGPRNAVVCATEGLLRTMPEDELRGVMAHELMHVRNRDILIGSVAAAIATAISFIANMAMWAAMFGGGGSNDDDRPNPFALILVSMLAPIAASLMQMAVSRSREFEADRSAAELLGNGATTGQRARAHRGVRTPDSDAGCARPGAGLHPQPARRVPEQASRAARTLHVFSPPTPARKTALPVFAQ